MKYQVVIGVFCTFLSIIEGYKILVTGPFNGKSHTLFMQAFVQKLLDRSHEVTFVTSISMSKQKILNYTEILIDPSLDFNLLVPQEELFRSSDKSPFGVVSDIIKISSLSTDFALSSKNVQNLIHSDNLHFDLVINEEFFHDAFSMFGYRFNAPVVTICPYGNSDFFDRQMGFLTPWSHIPHMSLTYSDNMSFIERYYNMILSTYDWLLRTFVHYPAQNEIAKKHFGHLGVLPTIEEVNRNVSLILVNTHRSLAPPRPSMPNIINIGGAHVKPAKPLPPNIEKFLDESTDGAIYFSLGTIIEGSKMPKEKLKTFLNVFRKLKQRILWKYEDESLTDIPANVLIQKWMPQNDILAHPNVKLFITHSGLFGTFEALAHGVPLVMIPFFGDQYRNAKRVVYAGYGKIIQFNAINADTLHETLNEVLTNESYSKKATELSIKFMHNLVHPMDEAMWWIEYVCKFTGASHLKSHAVNMSLFSYLLLDVLVVTLLAFCAVVYFIKKSFGHNKKNNPNDLNKKRN